MADMYYRDGHARSSKYMRAGRTKSLSDLVVLVVVVIVKRRRALTNLPGYICIAFKDSLGPYLCSTKKLKHRVMTWIKSD